VQAGRLPNPGFTFSRTSSSSSDVIVYNRSPGKSEQLHAHGAKVATSVAEACQAEVVFTMLSNDEAVEAVVFGPGGILASLAKGGASIPPGATIHSTSRFRDFCTVNLLLAQSQPVFASLTPLFFQ